MMKANNSMTPPTYTPEELAWLTHSSLFGIRCELHTLIPFLWVQGRGTMALTPIKVVDIVRSRLKFPTSPDPTVCNADQLRHLGFVARGKEFFLPIWCVPFLPDRIVARHISGARLGTQAEIAKLCDWHPTDILIKPAKVASLDPELYKKTHTP